MPEPPQLSQLHCLRSEPRERHGEVFRSLRVHADVRGPRVSEAWFAALAIESGSQWITRDRGFAGFLRAHVCGMTQDQFLSRKYGSTGP